MPTLQPSCQAKLIRSPFMALSWVVTLTAQQPVKP